MLKAFLIAFYDYKINWNNLCWYQHKLTVVMKDGFELSDCFKIFSFTYKQDSRKRSFLSDCTDDIMNLLKPNSWVAGKFCLFGVSSFIPVLPGTPWNFVTIDVCLFYVSYPSLRLISYRDMKLFPFVWRQTDIIPTKYKETYEKTKKDAAISL